MMYWSLTKLVCDDVSSLTNKVKIKFCLYDFALTEWLSWIAGNFYFYYIGESGT